VRSKNLLRRVRASRQVERLDRYGRVIRFDGWQLDCHKRLLTAPGNDSMRLPEGEFKLLHALINTPGRIFSRDQLLDAIRNREWTPNDRSVDVLVGRLRKKLCDNPANPQLILTAHGAGYMFAGNMQ